jgi:acetyl esterase
MCCYRRDEPHARQVWGLEQVPSAIVAMCGLLQASDTGRFLRRRKISRLFDSRVREVSRLYLRERCDLPDPADPALDLADPLRLLERGQPPDRPLPPFLASVGTHDPLLDDTRRLKVALDRLGVRSEAHYYPGELHAFQAFAWRRQAQQAWRDIYAFLELARD